MRFTVTFIHLCSNHILATINFLGNQLSGVNVMGKFNVYGLKITVRKLSE